MDLIIISAVVLLFCLSPANPIVTLITCPGAWMIQEAFHPKPGDGWEDQFHQDIRWAIAGCMVSALLYGTIGYYLKEEFPKTSLALFVLAALCTYTAARIAFRYAVVRIRRKREERASRAP